MGVTKGAGRETFPLGASPALAAEWLKGVRSGRGWEQHNMAIDGQLNPALSGSSSIC